MMTNDQQTTLHNHLVRLCELAKTYVTTGHKYKATILLRAPHLPDGDVLVSEDSDEAILAAIQRKPRQDPNGWQDIATAPQDGTWIIGYGEENGVEYMGYMRYEVFTGRGAWMGGSFTSKPEKSWVANFQPTKWRHIDWPAP